MWGEKVERHLFLAKLPPPRNREYPRKFVYFFDQSDSFLKPQCSSRIVPRNFSANNQKFCIFSPLYSSCFTLFLWKDCFANIKVSSLIFYLKFSRHFHVKICVRSLYVFVYVWKSCHPCHILYYLSIRRVTWLARPWLNIAYSSVWLKKAIATTFYGNTMIFYWI